MNKLNKLTICLLACFLLTTGKTYSSSAPTFYSAETKFFLRQWKEYKQKAENSLSIKEFQEDFGLTQTGNTGAKSEEWSLPVIISFESEQAMNEALPKMESIGFWVQTKLKTICTALIPADRISNINEIKGIKQLQATGKNKILMDKSRVATRVEALKDKQLESGSIKSFKGEGVLVGVVDVGFDYTHPNFYDIDDTSIYRLHRVWNQRAKGLGTDKYHYGREYINKEQILLAKSSSDGKTHGSHVAGIAAGSGAGTKYVGMAPKADMIFVSTTLTSAHILDGVKYIYDYAKERNIPCVVNLSIGGHVGPHDGTSAFDMALDQMKDPGFVVVGAAGNEGDDKIHIGHVFKAETKDTLFQTMPYFENGADPKMYIDMWSNDDAALETEVLVYRHNLQDPPVWRSGFISSSEMEDFEDDIIYSDTNFGEVSIISEINLVNGKHRIYTYIKINPQYEKNTKIILSVKSKNTKENASSNMWITRGSFAEPEGLQTKNILKAGDSEYTVGEIGGTSKSILTAGSYTTRTGWINTSGEKVDYSYAFKESDLSYFSSQGPTADGRNKPEITAPGAIIASSYNSYEAYSSYYEIEKVEKDGRKYPFCLTQGTSMASPAVAGIVALCLQVCPDWHVDSIRYYLSQTAINDNFTGNVRTNPSNSWGMGKIDAYALIEKAAGEKLNNEQKQAKYLYSQLEVYPNPNNGEFTIKLPFKDGEYANMKMIDRQGRLVLNKEINLNGVDLEIKKLNITKGLYLLRIENSKGAFSAKVIIK